MKKPDEQDHNADFAAAFALSLAVGEMNELVHELEEFGGVRLSGLSLD